MDEDRWSDEVDNFVKESEKAAKEGLTEARKELDKAIDGLNVADHWKTYLREATHGAHVLVTRVLDGELEPVSDAWSESSICWGWTEGNNLVRLTNGENGNESLRDVQYVIPLAIYMNKLKFKQGESK